MSPDRLLGGPRVAGGAISAPRRLCGRPIVPGVWLCQTARTLPPAVIATPAADWSLAVVTLSLRRAGAHEAAPEDAGRSGAAGVLTGALR